MIMNDVLYSHREQETNKQEEIKMKNFEETMRNAIVNSYIKVYGAEKWNGLTNKEKDMVLHIVLNDFAKAVGV